MNYRHAFHAGNFADCLKHALMLLLLQLMRRKEAPLAVLDTHAGCGSYDLLDEAQRTGEWKAGIARLIPPSPALAPYVGAVERLGLYPGSPALIRDALRPDDALLCCELHPEDAATLRRRFRADRQVAVHERDGYAAMNALLPLPRTRGLVLLDPPFEQPGEFDRLVAALRAGARRFDRGVYAAWYPIKHRSPVSAFHRAVEGAGLRNVVACELTLREPTDPSRLNGCGLLVRNPPFGFAEAAEPILAALRDALAERDGAWSLTRVTDE